LHWGKESRRDLLGYEWGNNQEKQKKKKSAERKEESGEKEGRVRWGRCRRIESSLQQPYNSGSKRRKKVRLWQKEKNIDRLKRGGGKDALKVASKRAFSNW